MQETARGPEEQQEEEHLSMAFSSPSQGLLLGGRLDDGMKRWSRGGRLPFALICAEEGLTKCTVPLRHTLGD